MYCLLPLTVALSIRDTAGDRARGERSAAGCRPDHVRRRVARAPPPARRGRATALPLWWSAPLQGSARTRTSREPNHARPQQRTSHPETHTTRTTDSGTAPRPHPPRPVATNPTTKESTWQPAKRDSTTTSPSTSSRCSTTPSRPGTDYGQYVRDARNAGKDEIAQFFERVMIEELGPSQAVSPVPQGARRRGPHAATDGLDELSLRAVRAQPSVGTATTTTLSSSWP